MDGEPLLERATQAAISTRLQDILAGDNTTNNQTQHIGTREEIFMMENGTTSGEYEAQGNADESHT